VLVIGRVFLDEVLFVLGDIVDGVNRIGGAGGNAGATVDAALGIDVHLSRSFELGLVLLGVNAIYGAGLDAEGILDAGISDYIGHDESISRNEMSTLDWLEK
jgi:hypothetical protein